MAHRIASATPQGHRRRIGLWVLGVLVLALVVFRLLLPGIVKRQLNQQLADLGNYRGEVFDVDIRLLRGAYVIDSMRIVKTTSKIPVPFFSVDRIDLSISWRDLFRGHLVSKIELLQPKLNFVTGPTTASSQGGADAPAWTDVVQGLFPIKINHLRVRHGQVHYRDFHTTPQVDVFVDSLQADVTNLTNSTEISESLFAKLDAKGRFMGTSSLVLKDAINPYEQQPTFDVNAELARMNLRTLNNLLRAYTQVDVERGTFGLYVELAASKGGFAGYAKPVFEDLKVLNLQKDSKKGIAVLWEAAIGAVTSLFQNHPKDQFATRIPFQGTFDDVKVNVWGAIGSILRNTFLEALIPQLDHNIGIDDAEEAVNGKDPKDRAREQRKQARQQRREEQKRGRASAAGPKGA